MVGTRYVLQLLTEWVYSIVYREALAWILMILIDDSLTCKLRYTHDAVGIVHTILLDAINRWVNLTTAAVEVCSMNVYAQRLARYILGMDASRECQPVVCVDDVEVKSTCHHTCNNGVVVNFLVQVGRISSGKVHTADVVNIHVVEIRIDMVAHTIVQFRLHDMTYAVLHIVIVNVTIGNRHTVHADNLGKSPVLVAPRFRKA